LLKKRHRARYAKTDDPLLRSTGPCAALDTGLLKKRHRARYAKTDDPLLRSGGRPGRRLSAGRGATC
jgi:hypothetical protein